MPPPHVQVEAPAPQKPPQRSLHTALMDDHRQLHRVSVELAEAARAGADASTIGEIWTRFTHALRRHFSTEEQIIFPLVRRTHPAEAIALLSQHDQIREQLDRLDVEVDLHVLREPSVRTLIADLEAHARREDLSLYQWAEVELSPGEKRRALDRLADRPTREW